MKSGKRGKSTSAVEVTHVSEHGFWLLLPAGEALLPFDTFPWFRDATIAQLQNVQLVHSDHLRWPDLDIDLAVDSVLHPDRYPLLSKAAVRSPAKRSAMNSE